MTEVTVFPEVFAESTLDAWLHSLELSVETAESAVIRVVDEQLPTPDESMTSPPT